MSVQFGQAKGPSIWPGKASPQDSQNGSVIRGSPAAQQAQSERPWVRGTEHSAQEAG